MIKSILLATTLALCATVASAETFRGRGASGFWESAETSVAAIEKGPEMKCPKAWALYKDHFMEKSGLKKPYMHCDYTTQTCQQGLYVGDGGTRIFEVLSKDRATVIGHYYCLGGYGCIDFDRGELIITHNGSKTSIDSFYCEGGGFWFPEAGAAM